MGSNAQKLQGAGGQADDQTDIEMASRSKGRGGSNCIGQSWRPRHIPKENGRDFISTCPISKLRTRLVWTRLHFDVPNLAVPNRVGCSILFTMNGLGGVQGPGVMHSLHPAMTILKCAMFLLRNGWDLHISWVNTNVWKVNPLSRWLFNWQGNS